MRRVLVMIAVMLMWIVVPTGLGGCQQALFPKDAPRTQFESHRQMRGQTVPLEEPDIFGNPQPALRARLGPR